MPILTRRRLGVLAAAMPVAGRAAPLPGMPGGACDCHVHIIGPPERFPMVAGRSYTPPQSTLAGLRALHERLGITRTVLIQPSFYGTDNRAMLEALAALRGTARAIAVLPPDAGDAELTRLDGLGVRGVRVNIESSGSRDPRGVTRDLAGFARRVKHLGWHIQIYAALSVIARIAPEVVGLPVPVVFDHFGMPDAALGPDQPGFGTLLDMVKSGQAYVKLSAPYRISRLPGFADAAPIARALIAAGPERMLWASDWPHTDHAPGAGPNDISPFRMVDDPGVLDLLAGWCPDEGARRVILADTPQRLYRFPA
jgi:predicted TIM-barrel fold metal-dependent hydrolase